MFLFFKAELEKLRAEHEEALETLRQESEYMLEQQIEDAKEELEQQKQVRRYWTGIESEIWGFNKICYFFLLYGHICPNMVMQLFQEEILNGNKERARSIKFHNKGEEFLCNMLLL